MPTFLAIVLGAAALSMGAYTALGRRRDEDASRKGSRFLLGLGDFFLHWFLWVLVPLEALSLRMGATADMFNAAGLAVGLASGVLIALGRLELGGWAIAVGGVCDILDGRIARATQSESLYGKFIDSTLDRFVEVFLFLGFAFYFRNSGTGAFLAAAALGGSVLVSYAQSRGETVGVSGAGGLMQRAERMVVLCLVALMDPPVSAALGRPEGFLAQWALALIALGTFGTAIYRTIWIALQLRVDRSRGGAPGGAARVSPSEQGVPGPVGGIAGTGRMPGHEVVIKAGHDRPKGEAAIRPVGRVGRDGGAM